MIRQIVLRNWMCFRGEHVVELGPRAHAVVCRYESDPGLSNKGGKSALLEAIDFALTGRLAKFRRFDADGWISRGEKDGAVCLVLEDGSAITRERRRGQATQVRFGSSASGGGAAQDEASAAILRHLRFDADDYRNVAYFEQKATARLVLTEPEKRLDIVRGWLGLEKAERAEERAGEIAADVVRELEKMRARRDALEATKPAAPTEDEDALARAVSVAEAALGAVREERRAFDQVQSRRRDDVELVERYDARVAEGTSLADEVLKLPDDIDERAMAAEQAWAAAHAAREAAAAEVARRKRVSLGQFDGRCPVAEIECPAKKQINADRATSSEAYEAAKSVEGRAVGDLIVATGKKNVAVRARDDAREKRQKLERLRESVREMLPDVKAARKRLKSDERVDADALFAKERSAIDALDMARFRWHAARSAREQRERIDAEVLRLQDEIDGAATDAAIAVRARGVLRAAQRRVAERALERINATASALLSDAGIDLSVELRWEREGKGLAKQCEECGAAFPTSAKVKQCEACGAARGQLIVQRLEFLPSDRSGAADDIAGVALQLAAGSWILSSRESPWHTAILDEPLASCDRTNRRALARQLVRLLDGGTWRQALVISHSSETVEMFPARIEVVVGRDGSRRIVQS